MKVSRRIISLILALLILMMASCTGLGNGIQTESTSKADSETEGFVENDSSEESKEDGGNMGGEASHVEVYELKVNNVCEPMGVDAEKSPRFSWKFSEDRRNVTQKAYRITVGSTEGASDVYVGDWVESNEQYGVTCDGLTLNAQTRYYWQVEVKDDAGNVGSASSCFETALTDAEWEQATWIGGANIRRLRNEITLKDDVKKARVYVTGLGYYEFYVNGDKVGDRVLDPAYGNYFEIVRYACFDITEQLRKGENSLGILLAKGLYGEKFSNVRKGIMYLSVEYVSGETEVFVTNSDWRMTETGAYTREEPYSGEDYDARLEDGWLECGYDDSAWKTAKPADQVIPVDNGVIITDCSDLTISPAQMSVNDYVIETEIEIVNVCGGLVFRAKDSANFYMWQFTGNTLRAHVWKDGGVTVIEQSYGINPYNGQGRIPVRIEVKGNTIRTTVNGKQLPDITDIANPTGTVGFRAAGSSLEHARFHHYSVKSISGEMIYTYEDVADWSDIIKGMIIMEPQLDPIRIVSSSAPVSVTKQPNGNYVVDTGVNSTGWIKLQDLNGASGTKITIRYAELLKEDGTIDPETMWQNYYSTYTMNGSGNESWSQKFCFTSFRYAEISGYDGLTADNIRVERLHTDVEATGQVESSNELFNQIQAAYVNSQLSNLIAVPLDCPHREKAPWLGDAHVTSESTLYNFDAVTLYERWFRDWVTEQREDGFFNIQIPDPGNISKGEDYIWKAAIMIIPWDVYQVTGDEGVLRENYDMIKLQAVWFEANEHASNRGYSVLGDWVGPDRKTVNMECVATAYYYHAMDLAAKIATVLGETEDAQNFAKKAERIKTVFNRQFFKKTYYDSRNETPQAVALAFGLVPEEHVETVLNSLAQIIMEDKAGHMSVGVAGVRTLPAALTKYDRPDLTYLMMAQTTYPGLGFMIESGATSLWEYWEHPDWEGVGEAGQNARVWRSQNHCFLGGGFSTWLYADLLGITAVEAGYDTISIKPQIVGDLTYAKGSVETVHGTVKVDWSVDAEGNLTMKVTIPANTVADVYVPVRGDVQNVTITEGEDVWFAGGEAKVDTYKAATDTHVQFRLGSGEYVFTMTGEGAYPFA